MAGTSRKKENEEVTKKTDRAGSRERAGKGEANGNGKSEIRERGTSRRQTETKGGQTKNSSSKNRQNKNSQTKNSSAKGTSPRQSGSGKRRTDEYVPEDDSFMKTEVAIIVTFAVSVLLFLSNFGICGTVGNLCRGVMLGIFGSVGYVAPVLLFVGTCFYMSNRGNLRAIVKMAAVVIVLLALCGLDQMLLGGGMREEWSLGRYYTESGASGSGGGFLGGLLVVALCSSVGTVGTYLILLVALAIGAVCITERSLVNFVKRGSGRAYEYAKEDMSRRRELHEERKEERRRLREEQRVRGVDLESTDLSDAPPIMRGFAAGIPEGTVLAGDMWEPGADDAAVSDAISDEIPDKHLGKKPDVDLNTTSDAGSDTTSDQAPESAEQRTSEKLLAEEKNASPVNPADVFRGKIQMPYSAPETDDSDSLLKQIYVRRDTRTVAELSGGMMGAAIKSGPGYQAVHNTARTEELSWPAAEEEGWTEEEIEVSDEGWPAAAEEVLHSAGDENWPSEASSSVSDDDWIDTTADLQDGRWKDTICTAGDESGVNYDSFYIPEEPKQVVTASGKVIDVDTELVRKTIERKKEKRKSLPGEELTVNEQIEKKAEAEKEVKKEYVFPPLDLLKKSDKNQTGFSEDEYKETAIKLQQTLQNFGVGVTVTNISCGPTVTRYELHPEQGVKVSKIVSLADDIKLNLAAADIRIEAPIPGKAAVGIEVPNKENSAVLLRDLLETDAFKRHDSRMAFAVGKDIGGQAVVSDIAKMPHLLIAGATGSGKSVCINTLIMSVIYKARPEEVKLIMIDPKVVELSVYNGIPHLLIPVVTDPKKASGALNWAVAEMMDRYGKFAKYGVRDLKGFNARVDSIKDIDDPKKPEKLPQIIIIVDELADLMMVAPGEVEDAICRLAQLARAAGIHLVIATQRPSVNVITGVIKANIPSRIAFSVSSGVDSRTIIDMVGAEKLLGKGDMLFYPSGYQKPQRVQGAFVSDQEVSAVVEFLTEQGMTAEYNPEVESKISSSSFGEGGSSAADRDSYFVQAGRFIIEKDKASIGMLQRMFKIGFNRAARIMDQLAEAGVVGEEEGTKPRKVLMSMEQFENMLEE